MACFPFPYQPAFVVRCPMFSFQHHKAVTKNMTGVSLTKAAKARSEHCNGIKILAKRKTKKSRPLL